MDLCSVRVSHRGLFDSSFVGFLDLSEASGLARGDAPLRTACTLTFSRDPLSALASDEVDIAVASLDELIAFSKNAMVQKFRVVGCVLPGDLSAIALLNGCSVSRACPVFGAVNPDVTRPLWDEVSDVLQVEANKASFQKIDLDCSFKDICSGAFAALEVHLHWEALLATRRGLVRHTLRDADLGVPTRFSHLLVAKEDFVLKNRKSIADLFTNFSNVYARVLAETKTIAELLCTRKVYASLPDPGFLLASFRVLAPQMQSFLSTCGQVRWLDLLPYVCWFQTRSVANKHEPTNPLGAFHLENLFASLPAEC